MNTGLKVFQISFFLYQRLEMIDTQTSQTRQKLWQEIKSLRPSNRPNTRLIRSSREQFAAISCQVDTASSPGSKSANAEEC